MKKTNIVAVAVMLAVSFYAYFFVFQKEQKLSQKKRDDLRVATSEGLENIIITTKNSKFELQFRDNEWWIIKPILYPAKPGFMERSLTVMNQVLADSVFDYEKDDYGFTQYESKMKLSYANGEVKELVLGTESGTGSQIYILNQTNKKVYAVHNVWGQLFYFEMKDLVSSFLPVRRWDIHQVELVENDQMKWFAKKSDKVWDIRIAEKRLKIPQEKLLWWLQSIKNMEISPNGYDESTYEKLWYVLRIGGSGGETEFHFNKEASEIYLPALKAIGQVDPFSLKSVEIELEKVLKSAK